MGTRVEAVATVTGGRGPFGRRALRLSDRAVRVCLERANRRPEELDLLVNVGLYKDKNLAEPALASIIQEDIGANPGDPPRIGRHGTFSFDVMNGGCGFLSAARLIHLFLGRGTARSGIVVAADARAGTRGAFPFPSVGGAVLLAHGDEDAGFGPFALHTFPELLPLFDARIDWEPARVGSARRGRNVLRITEAPGFATQCVERGVEAASAFLEKVGVRPGQVDLLVASQYPVHFAHDVARLLGIGAEKVPRVEQALEGAHTAGPFAALEAAVRSGLFERSRKALFLTAGAGLTIATALYSH
jgi:3-oxoacyl-[acyl-carrier-protein] synthase III